MRGVMRRKAAGGPQGNARAYGGTARAYGGTARAYGGTARAHGGTAGRTGAPLGADSAGKQSVCGRKKGPPAAARRGQNNLFLLREKNFKFFGKNS